MSNLNSVGSKVESVGAAKPKQVKGATNNNKARTDNNGPQKTNKNILAKKLSVNVKPKTKPKPERKTKKGKRKPKPRPRVLPK